MSSENSVMEFVRRYLAERRALGYELTAPGTELMRFARWLGSRTRQAHDRGHGRAPLGGRASLCRVLPPVRADHRDPSYGRPRTWASAPGAAHLHR